jgi:hypothetical protein
MTSESSKAVTCPACGATTAGKFCSECGAAVRDAACKACNTRLTPGARFCHNCGAPVGVGAATAVATPSPVSTGSAAGLLPWIVAAAAVFVLVVLVASQRGGGGTADSDARTSLSGGTLGGATPAPDISNMTPRERADRLYDRTMALQSAGKTDSAQFFASMAVMAYQQLGPLDDDLRYDFGRVADVAGETAVMRAQADSILRNSPTHLLGLILAVRAAEARGDATARAEFDRRFRSAVAAETTKALPEYERHRGDIQNALTQPRR